MKHIAAIPAMFMMPDKIVNPDDYDWTKNSSNRGYTKYQHLLDGNAREINIRDYGYTNLDNFRIMITSAARKQNLVTRSKKLDKYTLLFQVTGKREER